MQSYTTLTRYETAPKGGIVVYDNSEGYRRWTSNVTRGFYIGDDRRSLTVRDEFTVTGNYNNSVVVRDGRIAVIRSDCPGEDCVGCGWVSTSCKSVVCLPNGLEIRVVADSDVDFVVG